MRSLFYGCEGMMVGLVGLVLYSIVPRPKELGELCNIRFPVLVGAGF